MNNILLKNYTSFKIGGPAKYFFKVKTTKDLIKKIQMAKELNLPFFILGEGSNLLVSDKGYNGVVIKIENPYIDFENNKIITGVGTKLGDLVSFSAKKGLKGLEWAAGIPGTTGGAVRGSIKAFGESISDVIESVEALKVPELEIKNYKAKDCKFNYKESIFKENKNLIILSCTFRVEEGGKEQINDKIKSFLDYRKKNHPLDFPSAGSIFKNPKEKNAWELIKACKLNGQRIGNAQISEKHSNFIINLGNASSKDVLALIELAKNKVKEKFGIKLEPEIFYLE
jgi:UDP-N-acetylmuramate dehydrogenase